MATTEFDIRVNIGTYLPIGFAHMKYQRKLVYMKELQAAMAEKQQSLEQISVQMDAEKVLSDKAYKHLETTLRSEMYVNRGKQISF